MRDSVIHAGVWPKRMKKDKVKEKSGRRPKAALSLGSVSRMCMLMNLLRGFVCCGECRSSITAHATRVLSRASPGYPFDVTRRICDRIFVESLEKRNSTRGRSQDSVN